MIEKIIIQNLKGNNLTQSLTGKDIFCGENGVGKSSRLEAVAISLLGYLPGQGKKAEETFKFASSKSMTVGLITDNDFEFSRTFDKKNKDGKTTISQSIAILPSLGEKTVKDKEARIISEIGNFPIMLDFNEFLSLPDSKRRDFFYSLSGGSEKWDKERVQNYLTGNLLTKELKESSEEQFEVMEKCINLTLSQYPDRFDIQQGLTAMLEYAKDKLSYWKSEKETAEGAVSKLAELKNKLSETDRNIAENTETLEKLQQELIKIEKELSSSYEKKKIIDARYSKIITVQSEINHIENEKPIAKEADILEQIKMQEAKLKNYDYYADINKSKEASKVLSESLSALQKEQTEVYEIYTKLKFEKDALEKSLIEINEVNGRCIIHSQIKCDKDFSKFSAAKQLRITEIDSEVSKFSKSLDENKQKIDDIKKKLKNEEGLRENFASAEKSQNETNNIIKNYINELKLKLNDVQNFEKFKEERIKAKEAELLALRNEHVDTIAPLDIMEKQKAALNSKIAELKVRLDEQNKSKITLSNLKSSSIDVNVAEYNVESFKQLSAALGSKGIQGEIVKEMLDPIKNDIQENLRLMGIDNKFFFQMESDNGKEIFQFGWINERGYTVNFDTLNAAHKSILLVSILTAIVEKANPKLKLLAIDDVEHIVGDLFIDFINGLSAIAHKWDNILLAIATSKLPEVEGFKIWNLSEPEVL